MLDNQKINTFNKIKIINPKNIISEGMHLIAYVKDKNSGEFATIEDSDYNSKQQFENDLKANGYTNISILDNKDLYLIDNSDFTRVSQVREKLRELKKDINEYDEQKYPSLHKLSVDNYNKLKQLYDKVMKISLTEKYTLREVNNDKDIKIHTIKEDLNYINAEDEPRYNDYIGLSMQIDGTKTKIKNLKAKIKKDIYDSDKNKHKYLLNYYEQLLIKYEDAIKNIQKLKEDLNNNIILYHGSSNKNLTNLDIGKSEGNGDQLGKGIYLTSDYNEAQSYVGSEGKVYKVKLDNNLKLFNLNDKLSESIKNQLNKELNSSNNKDVKNYICMFNRKTYEVKDKQEGLKFYQDKQKEWEQLDNKYFGNRPKVVKNQNTLQVIYTDYNDIKEAIDNMTGENLVDTLTGDIDPEIFVTIIISSGYDGVITHNGKWYVIYKDIDKVHILNETKNSLKTIDTTKLPDLEYELESRSENEDYKRIYNKFKKSKTGKIKCTYNELDLISAIYSDNDIYDYNKLNIQNILYENNYIKKCKDKLEEVSRNEMLATSKLQTITRYKKSVNYKGFTIADIDTTSVFTTNSFRVTCRVGDYWDTVEMENILYWVEMEAEKEPNNQINTKSVTRAIMDAIDGTDIKVDCTCPDFIYRFAYKCSKMGCKYGKQETRPAKITNPNDFGFLCKHQISVLSNKKWLQQSSGTLMNFLEERIDDVNKFLRRPIDDQLTLPNELARRNARKGFYTKLFKDRLEDEEDNENIENNIEDNDKDIDNNNNTNTHKNDVNNSVVGNNPSTNKLNNINNNEEEENNE